MYERFDLGNFHECHKLRFIFHDLNKLCIERKLPQNHILNLSIIQAIELAILMYFCYDLNF